LDSARLQIDAMKQEAADAALLHAEETARLEEARLQTGVATSTRDAAAVETERLRAEAARLIEDNERLRETLPNEIRQLTDRKDALADEIERLRPARDHLLTTQEEAHRLAARLESLRVELDKAQQAEQAALARITALSAEREALGDTVAALRAEVAQLRPIRDLLLTTQEEVLHLAARLESLRVEQEKAQQAEQAALARITALSAEREALGDAVAALRADVAQLRPNRDRLLEGREEAGRLAERIAQLRDEHGRAEHACRSLQVRNDALAADHATLVAAVAQLHAEQESLAAVHDDINALEARKAALEELVAGLRAKLGGTGAPNAPGPDMTEQMIHDLRGVPACVDLLPKRAHPAERELDALQGVCRTLTTQGLEFDPRKVFAFHTALKINEVAQMTVLAGVSGTGKSLLPRRYAAAMGIGFLQIAVEPRWDSPQDLLGFYNYIEQRYRATDLARALVQMDPYNTSDLGEPGHGDKMMLVLLDEMNLARVEYYFSEFLSRLEVRPRLADAADPDRRQVACLPIDIPGRADGPVRLFPAHNVLFVGTMNDDESTQALSDKVLDRGNIVQFAAPARFARPADGLTGPGSTQYRSFAEWRKWVRPLQQLDGGERQRTEDVIGDLSRMMEEFGRPFGHRLNEAMLAYIANYPRAPGDSVALPIADQIEMRILPKLRGLSLEDFGGQFDTLAKLIRDDAGDDRLAARLEELVATQKRGIGQFSWRGLDRGIG